MINISGALGTLSLDYTSLLLKALRSSRAELRSGAGTNSYTTALNFQGI